MTNEEAFEQWFENTVLNDNIHDVAEWAWNAAIAYMQEQDKLAEQSEPLKRLSQLDVLKILNECAKSPYTNTQSSLGFANAIMDAMQEINK